MIFHQGENNSGQQSWPGYVKTYVDSLRQELRLNASETPFIAGARLTRVDLYVGWCHKRYDLPPGREQLRATVVAWPRGSLRR